MQLGLPTMINSNQQAHLTPNLFQTNLTVIEAAFFTHKPLVIMIQLAQKTVLITGIHEEIGLYGMNEYVGLSIHVRKVGR